MVPERQLGALILTHKYEAKQADCGFKTSKLTPRDTPPRPCLLILCHQAFIYTSLWGPFSFRPPHWLHLSFRQVLSQRQSELGVTFSPSTPENRQTASGFAYSLERLKKKLSKLSKPPLPTQPTPRCPYSAIYSLRHLLGLCLGYQGPKHLHH